MAGQVVTQRQLAQVGFFDLEPARAPQPRPPLTPRSSTTTPSPSSVIELEHDAEKWVPVSRLREARGTVRRLA
jgi:hypothetical protein